MINRLGPVQTFGLQTSTPGSRVQARELTETVISQDLVQVSSQPAPDNSCPQKPAEAHSAAAPKPSIQTGFQGCVGRLIRGKSEADFETLTPDPNRRVVFLMDSDGLGKLEGKSGYQQLMEVGKSPKEILDEIQNQGLRYKLVVWPGDSGPTKQATWDNLLDMMSEQYPQVADKIQACREELKAEKTFGNWEKQAGFEFGDVKRGDPRYVGYEELQQREGKPWEVRAFLYNSCNVNSLYSGDGFTKRPDGSQGVPEYIVPNLKINELPSARVLNVSVSVPATLPILE